MKFIDFDLNQQLLKGISEMGFENPTEIQQKAIPLLLAGEQDFVGQAQTGTGKTAAFGLPLLNRLNEKQQAVQALILTPTRELAVQVCDEMGKLGKFTNFKSLAIYGGTSYDKQKSGLKRKKPAIVVGTPGRVIDLIEQGVLDLSFVETFILDEADEMLNMGFFEDVQKIVSFLNEDKRMWMFSATMPKPILNMINTEFKNPEIIKVKKETLSNADVEQRYYIVQKKNFNEALIRLLAVEPDFYGIIFCRTRQETKDLAEDLLLKGILVETLHGELGQAQRDQAMNRFKSQKSRIMVCTDVAARGIDVNDLTHVINYGLPQECESYVHRIGRTGRAGQKGVAISLVDPREKSRLGRIEKITKSAIELCKLPSVDVLKEAVIMKELERMSSIADVLYEKGDSFRLDDNYYVFEEAFGPLSKEDALKVLFTTIFNKDLKRLDDLGDIDNIKAMKKKQTRDRGVRRTESRRQKRGQRRETQKGHVRLFMNMGKDDGLNLMSLLDDVSKQTKCQKKHIQNVDMKSKFSFFEVPARYGDVLLTRKMKVKNRPVRFEVSN